MKKNRPCNISPRHFLFPFRAVVPKVCHTLKDVRWYKLMTPDHPEAMDLQNIRMPASIAHG